MARTSFATRAEGVRTLASTMRQTGIKAVYWKLRLCERGRAPCRTRTCDLLVRSLMQVVYPVGSSMVYLTPRTRCSSVFGSKLFTDCSLGAQIAGAQAPLFSSFGASQTRRTVPLSKRTPVGRRSRRQFVAPSSARSGHIMRPRVTDWTDVRRPQREDGGATRRARCRHRRNP